MERNRQLSCVPAEWSDSINILGMLVANQSGTMPHSPSDHRPAMLFQPALVGSDALPAGRLGRCRENSGRDIQDNTQQQVVFVRLHQPVSQIPPGREGHQHADRPSLQQVSCRCRCHPPQRPTPRQADRKSLRSPVSFRARLSEIMDAIYGYDCYPVGL